MTRSVRIDFRVTDEQRKRALHWSDAPPELWVTPVIAVMCCAERVGVFRPPKPDDGPLWVRHEITRPWVLDGDLIAIGAGDNPVRLSRRSRQRMGRPGAFAWPTSTDVVRSLTTERRLRGTFACSGCGTNVPFRLENLILVASALASDRRWVVALADLPKELLNARFR